MLLGESLEKIRSAFEEKCVERVGSFEVFESLLVVGNLVRSSGCVIYKG